MTGQIGASEVIAAPAPITDPNAARIRMGELTNDPEFMKRVTAKDAEAFAEYNRLWRVSRGMPPEPLPPFSQEEVVKEADQREVRQLQEHDGVLERQGYTPEQRLEIIGQRPIVAEEKALHARLYNEKRNNREFMNRWIGGDPQAIKEMHDHAIAMRMPDGSLEDVRRWEGS
jgi:hypothetical protein